MRKLLCRIFHFWRYYICYTNGEVHGACDKCKLIWLRREQDAFFHCTSLDYDTYTHKFDE